MSSITFPYGEIYSALDSESTTKLTYTEQTKTLKIQSTIIIDLTNVSHEINDIDVKEPDTPGLINLKLNADIHDNNPEIQIVSIQKDLHFLQKSIKVNGIKKDHEQ